MSVVFTVDGVRLARDAGQGFKVTRERGWYAGPPAAPTVAAREGADGGVDGPTWRGPRVVSLGGIGRWDSHEAAMAAAHAFLALAPAPGRLEVVDAFAMLTAPVRLASEPFVQWLSDKVVEWDVAFVSPDHRKYGPAVSFSTPLPSDPATGIDTGTGLDFTGGLDFGAAPALGVVQVANAGTAPSDPLLRLVGGTTGLTGPVEVVEGLAGRRLVFDGDIAPGQVVELDAGPARSVLLDGYASRRELLSLAQWWQVPPSGVVVPVSWSHAGGQSSDARLEVIVSPAYL